MQDERLMHGEYPALDEDDRLRPGAQERTANRPPQRDSDLRPLRPLATLPDTTTRQQHFLEEQ